MGRFGLFGPDSFAITPSSVERCQFGFDPDVPLQRPVEGSPRDCPFEAGEPPAGVGTPAGLVRSRHEHAVLGDEAQELALQRLPAAAGAAPDRLRHAAGVSSPPSSCAGSTGSPAGTSSSGAVAGGAMSRSTSPSASAITSASGPCVAATS